MGVVALLFAMEETHDGKAPKPSQDAAVSGAVSSGVAQSSAIGSTLWSGLGTVSSVRATLSNDLDHDGNYDGMADPLVALCTLIVLYGCFIVLVMPLVGRLLLRLYKLPILVDSDYCLALERPG